MAACVQHKGTKFQWAPLIQGTQGNGKTLLTRCVAFAVGQRYTHLPLASEIAEKFNEWLFNTLFIGVEDVYVPDHKKEILEVLKPMITNDRLAMRAMQQGQVMGDNRGNFMLNSNHLDGIRKTRDDRRFCVFYSAQQTVADLKRDGMTGNYFPTLYGWLKAGGYAIVCELLNTYAIPDDLNPAGQCVRAPDTTSTERAVEAGLGEVEQQIMEAVANDRPGFCGGWVSSAAVDRLLTERRLDRAAPTAKRRGVLQALGFDWHPALAKSDGRVNNKILEDGGKPKLYVLLGSPPNYLPTAGEAVNDYKRAQGYA
jgi:hypothetical protein